MELSVEPFCLKLSVQLVVTNGIPVFINQYSVLFFLSIEGFSILQGKTMICWNFLILQKIWKKEQLPVVSFIMEIVGRIVVG